MGTTQPALEFPVGCGPTHLNFILPSTTWLTTVADVILGTKGQALRWGTTPRLPTSALQGEQEMGAPLGEAALACSSDPCSAQERPPGVTTVPGLGKAWHPPSSPWGGAQEALGSGAAHLLKHG